jgi:hypothetical protein
MNTVPKVEGFISPNFAGVSPINEFTALILVLLSVTLTLAQP